MEGVYDMLIKTVIDFIVGNIGEIKTSDWVYICAIALQLAGALILIAHVFKDAGMAVKRLYVNDTNGLGVVSKGMVTYEKDRLQTCARQVYLNRVSFLFILGGYVLGIYGEITIVNRHFILGLVLLATLSLIVLGKLIAWVFSIILYRKDIVEDYEKAKKGNWRKCKYYRT